MEDPQIIKTENENSTNMVDNKARWTIEDNESLDANEDTYSGNIFLDDVPTDQSDFSNLCVLNNACISGVKRGSY